MPKDDQTYNFGGRNPADALRYGLNTNQSLEELRPVIECLPAWKEEKDLLETDLDDNFCNSVLKAIAQKGRVDVAEAIAGTFPHIFELGDCGNALKLAAIAGHSREERGAGHPDLVTFLATSSVVTLTDADWELATRKAGRYANKDMQELVANRGEEKTTVEVENEPPTAAGGIHRVESCSAVADLLGREQGQAGRVEGLA